MEFMISGRNLTVSDRFREYAVDIFTIYAFDERHGKAAFLAEKNADLFHCGLVSLGLKSCLKYNLI